MKILESFRGRIPSQDRIMGKSTMLPHSRQLSRLSEMGLLPAAFDRICRTGKEDHDST